MTRTAVQIDQLRRHIADTLDSVLDTVTAENLRGSDGPDIAWLFLLNIERARRLVEHAWFDPDGEAELEAALRDLVVEGDRVAGEVRDELLTVVTVDLRPLHEIDDPYDLVCACDEVACVLHGWGIRLGAAPTVSLIAVEEKLAAIEDLPESVSRLAISLGIAGEQDGFFTFWNRLHLHVDSTEADAAAHAALEPGPLADADGALASMQSMGAAPADLVQRGFELSVTKEPEAAPSTWKSLLDKLAGMLPKPEGELAARPMLAADAEPREMTLLDLGPNSAVALVLAGDEVTLRVDVDPPERLSAAPTLTDDAGTPIEPTELAPGNYAFALRSRQALTMQSFTLTVMVNGDTLNLKLPPN